MEWSPLECTTIVVILGTHAHAHHNNYRVYLIPKYIPGAAPINPDLSEGNSPPNDITKQNVLLSKLIESKLGGRIGKFKTELSKEMVEMIETSGLLKPKM